MTQQAAHASVEVEVVPDIAFIAFTDEIDCWWVRGAINFFDAARTVAIRMEQGVGGRVLEVYDEDAGDALELARITVWEPGQRLTYRSSVDDTEVDVQFSATATGTRVDVRQYLLPDGEVAFLFWPKMCWPLAAWCRRRDTAVRAPREVARLSVALYYNDPIAASRWLTRVFGLSSWYDNPAPSEDPSWNELHVGDVAVLLFPAEKPLPEPTTITHTVWVFVDDLDAHLARATEQGATVVEPIHQHGYRAYVAEDLEGHRWTFAQARPTMT